MTNFPFKREIRDEKKKKEGMKRNETRTGGSENKRLVERQTYRDKDRE
jgi:hypothetical protein